jgi:REP element-mobilizing transposase RayT
MTKSRNFKPNNPYHIYNRGNKKERIFLNEKDYLYFEDALRYAAGMFNVWIYAWCLMGNHYHLLIKAADPESIMLMMQRITTSYSFHMRRKYHYVGHVFQGRYCTVEIENKEHFQIVLKYIKNNPVKKKLCIKSEDYRWLTVISEEY